MKNSEDFPNRKEERREKFKKKNNRKPTRLGEDDCLENQRPKPDIKRLKEDFQNEEWEDWDRYYNR
jgi:hypothetical protein